LKTQGIESYYSVVYAGDAKLGMEKDFAIMQGNHVILNVPDESGDIWLECTSQQIPFGFLSDFTDDRDVLVVTPEGGEIKHTKAYLNDQNWQRTNGVMKILPDGSLDAQVTIKTHAIQYDKHSEIQRMSQKNKDEYYKQYRDNINGLNLEEVSLKNDKENVEFVENVSLSAKSYASQIGDELLFKPNAFNISSFVPDRYKNRKLSFQISRGYTDIDEVIIHLPGEFKLKELPSEIKINSEFGNYQMSLERIGENQIKYNRKIQIFQGLYTKDKYSQYRDFRRAIKNSDNLKLILGT